MNDTVTNTETATVPVTATFDNTVDKVTTKFSFRKVKDEATGLESKRPTVEIDLPLLSIEGIVKVLEAGGKGLDLIVEAVRDVQIARAREIISEKEDISAESFPYNELDWATIANLPKAERRGGGISKEIWDEFGKDYAAVMPGVTRKTAEQVANAVKIFLNKLQQVKTNKPVLKLLKGQLALYVNSSPNAENDSDCVTFLTEKADAFLNMTEAALLANL